ncbi:MULTISPECIES: DUF1659 domain-containing protein [unclassified Lysinibacillus]|uniref:DUF1659 domain-containing protein n=1 Tax=unclassified Lysinibacillus TaxID=2636778 RepID=UPI002013A9EB|nr:MULTISPECIES: DUF1659 domain-containing protein [unclassified Lysinibacillus]MCL1694409.1 DUF1659 domain-containing protein [Lysinibacillus sp. BPa_S21]MCL1699241.1 DUF1659 domain-containing protein [Lysinibacillus sp. Bpr_S20]
MAKVNFVGATLRLKYVDRHNAQNEPMFTTKTYRNLNGSHTAEDLVEVAYAIASLSSHALDSIVKLETTELS